MDTYIIVIIGRGLYHTAEVELDERGVKRLETIFEMRNSTTGVSAGDLFFIYKRGSRTSMPLTDPTPLDYMVIQNDPYEDKLYSKLTVDEKRLIKRTYCIAEYLIRSESDPEELSSAAALVGMLLYDRYRLSQVNSTESFKEYLWEKRLPYYSFANDAYQMLCEVQ
jgi:hypothetical protein